MSKDEFEQGYAERSKISIEKLHELRGHAVSCDCDEPECDGWQMGFMLLLQSRDDGHLCDIRPNENGELVMPPGAWTICDNRALPDGVTIAEQRA